MSKRFEALGNYVYEKGNRIGVTPDEASVELARKLNAYQMRIERLKAQVERLRTAGDAIIQNLDPEEGDWSFEDAQSTWEQAKK